MVFPINFPNVCNISMIGNTNNLEFSRLKERFPRMAIYNFPKDFNSARFSQ